LPSYSSIADKINKVKSGELSLTENVKEYLAKIDEHKNVNVYNSIFKDEALKEAEEIESEIKAGKHGKLAGSVIAIKDVLSIINKPTTCSSKILKDPNRSAWILFASAKPKVESK